MADASTLWHAMEESSLAGEESGSSIAREGIAGTAVIVVASLVPFLLTAEKCDTSPQGDTSSQWSFSGYCRAFHSPHLFNYPDSVSGGGALEAVFVLPILISILGLVAALSTNRKSILRKALATSAGLIALLAVLSLILASATFHAF